MRLEISRDAEHDLRELHAYGLREYGPRQADAYLSQLFAKFEHIAQWPYSARLRQTRMRGLRIAPFQAHNIVYEVEEGVVVILRVYHHTANYIALL